MIVNEDLNRQALFSIIVSVVHPPTSRTMLE
jgi:hypothetical protein